MQKVRTSVGVLDKTMAILATYDRGKPLKTPGEVAVLLKLPLPTIYRFMQGMAQHGLLEREGREFRLGLRLAALGAKATRDLDLRRVALPHLRNLSQKTGEHTRISVRRGAVRVNIESISGANNRWPINLVGETLPLGVGSSGLIMLAWLPEEEALSLAAESFSIFNKEGQTENLPKRLAKVRADGYVVSLGERHSEVNAIAAPVYNAQGEVIAALSLVVPKIRCTPKQIKLYTPWVVEAAGGVSTALGYESKFLNG